MGSATFDCQKCGASVRVSRGNNKDSERYARYCEARGDLCQSCSKAEFAAQHAAKIAEAAASPLNAALPPLVGTDKQIQWAQALRLEALPRIEEACMALLSLLDHSTLSEQAQAEVRDALHLLAQELRERTEASAWIDWRAMSVGNIRDAMSASLQARKSGLCPTAVAEEAARRQAQAEG